MAYSSMRYQYETSPRKLKPEEKTKKLILKKRYLHLNRKIQKQNNK